MSGHDNNAFIGDTPSIPGEYKKNITQHYENTTSQSTNPKDAKYLPTQQTNEHETTEQPVIPKPRDEWGKGIEFLLSCIAMSVGLGNVWRFPFTALENGGGAFVIPYLVVLLLVGKPIYFMEMLIGQFSSRGSVKVYDFAPAMRGVGYGQLVAVAILTTYYSSLMALISRYLIDSFKNPLPWSWCRPEWVNCIGSGIRKENGTNSETSSNRTEDMLSSSELYFTKVILKEKDSIDDGIGMPDLGLVLCLAISWGLVLLTLIKGVKSAGKASYFLALFPYFVMTILLVRACTLPGAINGIIFFLKPQWDQILNPKVWYAAVTQVFFSLSICFGNIIMYSSYNKFNHNVHRDATIVTTIDTFTSLLAGCTIFGILGHLAYEIGTDDIGSVVKGGTGLAFISYPDAIAKFELLPQAFSVLFFLMLFVLGIGSNVAMTSCVMTVIRDKFPQVKNWQAGSIIALIGLALGTIYVTPGGQYILNLVDFFGASFIAFVLAIAELIAIGWIYGIDRFCKDVEFMLGMRPNLYWRLCWRYITPLLMIIILIYTLVTLKPITYRDYVYPDVAYACGWCIAAFGLIQLPLWAFYAIVKQEGKTWGDKIVGAFRPKKDWGPADPALNHKYKEFINTED